MHCTKVNGKALLPALAAVTESANTLLGPCRSRKQISQGGENVDCDTGAVFTANIVTVLRSLHVEHPIIALLLKTVESHINEFGTGATTLVTLVHTLTDAAMDLQHISPYRVTRGFGNALARCMTTLTRMRMNIQEWLRETSWRHDGGQRPLSYSIPLLGTALSSTHPDRAAAMAKAVEVALSMDSFDLSWPHHVHFHAFVGPSNAVHLTGLFLDISDNLDGWVTPHDGASGNLSTFSSHHFALMHGDIVFSSATCLWLESARVVVASGSICAKTVDWCRHRHAGQHAIACIPHQRLADLRHVSLAFGVSICEDVCERALDVAGCAIHASVYTLHNRTFLRLEHDSQFRTTPVTVLVGGMTASAAVETQAQIVNALHRLAHALDDQVVLPGGGAAFAACAASLRRQPPAPDDVDVELATRRFGEALEDWCVGLVLNSTSLTDATLDGGYLAAKTKLHDVLAAFDEGEQDDKFLEATFYGASLTPVPAPRGTYQFDGYTSTKAALTSAVRVVSLALNIGTVIINQP
ncbi:hypothetical protein, variant 4 [Aphanomyces invadans]|uniref:CCT-eta n=1 Tax=Aphanomyces invadans TaxID=157072 RepID=A0A024U0V9_9STRA|nr:hypothetical protein, variant 2 [Aphanomyces invadans]XP_008872082.1 hypothetical protein, variant 3 [Aphanomyces invadans]XP_008872083.1 hypothetical protein, variant 4 [Aphanomyces invadans]ETV99525.1 hypothetical protein, variant 2 [Aphanomyces invadans]ETV99526.1 hypothetical protein, variant 3 [Aphanomyces invadans]ETV99527.1 hypothetical protein, variant 4 [Aphanomyces invadans]|eukprot:XP_008872081.1 hypothetical protein, variant 2 [Aphanomyces invadans]